MMKKIQKTNNQLSKIAEHEVPIQILIKQNQKKIKATRELIAKFFKNSKGEPYIATDGQCLLFEAVVNKKYKWVWDSAPTRYGKTEILAMALIYLAVLHKLKIPIVGGSMDKAGKIMEYIVAHLADHEEFSKGLINAKEFSNIEMLKVKVSKTVLRWRQGGWIFITSVDARQKSKEGEGVVGDGGDVIVLEEAGLIKEESQFSKVVRMSEEDRGWGKLIMSGNCVEKSVFETAYHNPLYYIVRVTLEQAIKEGRYTEQSLQEKKKQTTSKDWKRYYLVLFPGSNEFSYFKPKKYEVLPNDLEYYGALDPALGESKKGSLVGIVILGRSRTTGQVYEVDSMGEQLKPEEQERVILNLPYTFQRYGVEAVQFQKYFLNQMKKNSQLAKKDIPFKGIQQSGEGKKMVRIESLEPYINTGQILFKGGNELWKEMQDYPECEHFDVLDTLEMAWRLIHEGNFDYTFV